ncbi:MAG: glutamyl-tRNA reductase [Firmicutes bacterium]|nr:glutamyl-tRNA reductase [Bacillota bacterium]
MHFALVGLNHRTAPVEVRETLAFGPETLLRHLEALSTRPLLREAAILCTCNRTEVYAVTSDPEQTVTELSLFLEEAAAGKKPSRRLSESFYRYRDLQVAQHLFQVAAGIDSMLVGEPQILGQVRDSYDNALKAGTAGAFLSQLMRRGIEVGKRVRSETGIGEGAASISYAAVELSRKIFGELHGKKVLLVGAGEMAELAAKTLASHGARTVFVANRTYDRAVQLAQGFDGVAVRFSEIQGYLGRADIVISSTAAPHPIIDRKMVREAMHARKGRPLFLIDIAVPRDVEPAVHRLEGVYLYNIDDLKSVVAANIEQRSKELGNVESIVAEELSKFAAWMREQETAPVIAAFRRRAEEVRERELLRTLRRLKGLSEDEVRRLEAMTRAIVNKILHSPTAGLRESAHIGNGRMHLDAVARLFGIEALEELVPPRGPEGVSGSGGRPGPDAGREKGGGSR